MILLVDGQVWADDWELDEPNPRLHHFAHEIEKRHPALSSAVWDAVHLIENRESVEVCSCEAFYCPHFLASVLQARLHYYRCYHCLYLVENQHLVCPYCGDAVTPF